MIDRTEVLWEQVAELRPRLRKDVRIIVQDYRGERWYLLHDESAGRFLRFNAAAYELLGRLDGDLTLREILDLANAADPDHAVLEAGDVLQILAQLHGAEVLRGALPLSAQDVFDRYEQTQRYRRRRALSNPLALRLPMLDPDRLLDRLFGVGRLVFSWAGLWLWLGVLAIGVLTALTQAQELGAAIADKTLSPYEVLSFWIAFPVIKAIHELGHGLAVKTWGGQVHEAGINLLVFMPVPYVDASAAWGFRDKRRRALVGAAGIMVELFIAALAVVVWSLVEPGVVRDFALNVALIGSVSSLLFNGNPLLRFDAYYVLEDLFEIPNLATRSSRFYIGLFQRHLLGLKDVRSVVTADGERAWFAVYGIASPVYRLIVIVGIALYLSAEYLVVGVILAIWALFMQVFRPLYSSIHFLATSPRLEARRIRGFAAVGGLLAVVVGLLVTPAPLVTQTEGVVWLDDENRVVSGIDGFVKRVVVADGEHVAAGDLVIELEDAELRMRHQRVTARLAELRTERAAQRNRSRVRAAMVADDIAAAENELGQIDDQLAQLQVRSRSEGVFYAVEAHDLIGRFMAQGDLIGYILHDERPVVRAVLTQQRAGLMRTRPAEVEVMLADRLGQPVAGSFAHEIPAATTKLPSAALGALGGGEIAIDTRDETGMTAAETVFQLDILLPRGTPTAGVGERVYVRLDHGEEPLWKQWSRSLQQLLLSRLDV